MYAFLGTGRWSDRALERRIGRVLERSIGVRSSIVYMLSWASGRAVGGMGGGWWTEIMGARLRYMGRLDCRRKRENAACKLIHF